MKKSKHDVLLNRNIGKKILKKRQDEISLSDWIIYLVKAKKSEVKTPYKKRDGIIKDLFVDADISYNELIKVAFLRYVKLTERLIIHELLHIACLTESETKVENRTIKIIKGLKKKYELR